MGIRGAAVATVFAEYCEVAAMLFVLSTSRRVGPSLSLPDWKSMKKIIVAWFPLTIDSFCKGSCYLCIQWSAASLKVLELAAHQAMYAWWNLTAFCQNPVKDSALAFIPAAKSELYDDHAVHRVALDVMSEDPV